MSPAFDVTVLPHDADPATVIVEDVLEAARDAARLRVLTTGGRTGARINQALAGSGAALDLWWSDERALPVGHPERNDSVLPQEAFEASGSACQWHRYPSIEAPTSAALTQAARDYAASLPEAFDYGVISLGEDGHIASLFPPFAATWRDSGMVLAIDHAPKPPPQRLTLGVGGLALAQRLCIVVSGESKIDAVRALIAMQTDYPSTWLAQERITLLVDQAAAQGL